MSRSGGYNTILSLPQQKDTNCNNQIHETIEVSIQKTLAKVGRYILLFVFPFLFLPQKEKNEPTRYNKKIHSQKRIQ